MTGIFRQVGSCIYCLMTDMLKLLFQKKLLSTYVSYGLYTIVIQLLLFFFNKVVWNHHLAIGMIWHGLVEDNAVDIFISCSNVAICWYNQTEALTVSQTATCQQSNYCCHPLVIPSMWGGGKQGQIWLGRAAGGGGAAQQQEQEEEEKEEEEAGERR